jgi:hypothetical protein
MRRLFVAALAMLAACDWGGPTPLTILHLKGAYEITYTPVEGKGVAFEREPTVFNDPDQPPVCCLGVYRRTASTFELAVGNRVEPPVDAGDACAPVVHLRVYVSGVDSAAPQVIALGPDNTRAFLYYSEPPAGAACPRYADPWRVSPREVVVTGELKFAVMHCLDEPDELGCALIANGGWTLTTADGALTSSGWFISNDDASYVEF